MPASTAREHAGASTRAPSTSTTHRRQTFAVERLTQAGNPNYMELSIAAKAYYILKRRNEGMSKYEIIREALKFAWNIESTSLESGVSFLEKLGVLER